MKNSNPRPPLRTPHSTLRTPLVLLNLAMTADGKITTSNRAVSGFSSRRDQRHIYELRSTADAVMSGARTTDLHPVTLGPGPAQYRRLRLQRGLAEYNLRIIVSGSGSVNPAAEIFKKRFSPVILLTTRRASARRLKALAAAGAIIKICGAIEINFRRALIWLHQKWGVKRLLCEGGGELNDALFRAGLVDELHLTLCPRIFGGNAAPTISDGLGAKSLARPAQFELHSARRHAGELFLIYYRK